MNPNQSDQSDDIEIHHKESNSKILKCIIILPLLGGILFALVYGLNFYNALKAAEKQEKLDFAVLCKENYNIEDYEKFLRTYPQSIHYREAKQRLAELHSLAAAWESIKHSKNKNVFVDFKNQYSDPRYAQLCNIKLDSIDWQEALNQNTPDAYQGYMNLHPQGKYVADAIIAKTEVGYMSINEQEKTKISVCCHRFFTALGLINNTSEVLSFLSPAPLLFMDKKAPSQDDILQWIERSQENHTFVTYLIHDDERMRKDITEDNQQTFTTHFTTDKITTDETGKETTKTYETIVIMDTSFQISSITLKEI